MFNLHPNNNWNNYFLNEEKLKAFTVYPIILEPERYKNQKNYLSDTENSKEVNYFNFNEEFFQNEINSNYLKDEF
jgi:hypothetical protein